MKHKLIVGIDAHFAGVGIRRGIGNYTFSFIHALARKKTSYKYVIFLPREGILIDFPEAPHLQYVTLPTNNPVLNEQLFLPYYCYRYKVDILHSMANTAPFFLPSRSKLIVTLHDLMFMPGVSREAGRGSLRQIFASIYRASTFSFAAPRSAAIFSVSQQTKNDVQQIFGQRIYDKVLVTGQGVSAGFRLAARAVAGEPKFLESDNFLPQTPYLLILGAKDPRKNLRCAIQALRICVEMGLDLCLVVGGMEDFEEGPYGKYAASQGVAEKIISLGFVSNQQLVLLYLNAIALLFPSKYEGFGLPVLEAFAMGCPVVASCRGSVPEIAGDAAILCHPDRPVEFASSIKKIMLSQSYREELITKGFERTEAFSWTRIASDMEETYASVLSRKA